MMIQMRLELAIEVDAEKTEAQLRNAAKEMGIVISRVKARQDVVQLYGYKAVK